MLSVIKVSIELTTNGKKSKVKIKNDEQWVLWAWRVFVLYDDKSINEALFIKRNHHNRTRLRMWCVLRVLVFKYVPALYIAIRTLILFHDQEVKL